MENFERANIFSNLRKYMEVEVKAKDYFGEW